MSFSSVPNLPQESTLFKISYNEPDSIALISEKIDSLIANIPIERAIVVVCVGTDRSTGDSLGPLVGSHLNKANPSSYYLFGTLENPVHAMNLAETIRLIESQFRSPYIIAIDACLGQLASVGSIQVGSGPLKPGSGVNKDLPPVGDAHLTGIVNVGGFMEYFVLQNTRLHLVIKMAEVIADSIHSAVSRDRIRKITPLLPHD